MFFIDPEVCTGCGECKDACPCDAISEDENGRCSQEEIESLKI